MAIGFKVNIGNEERKIKLHIAETDNKMLPKTTISRRQDRESHHMADLPLSAQGYRERKVEFRMLQSELPEGAPSGTEGSADGVWG